MAEFTKWELTDEELSRCISKCHENFLNSETADEANEWRQAMTAFLSEQRQRMDLMLKDETEASKLTNEHLEFKENKELDERKQDLEEQKAKVNKAIGIGQIIVGFFGAVATVASAVLNYKGKKYEYDKKVESWDRICKLEEDGEIPLNSANKFIKL
jgi:hypothetical protein